MQTERTHWIDIARGIGIIFIIYGHGLVMEKQIYSYLLYAFHIPLFFFLSGVLYNANKYPSLLIFLKKSAKRLLVPYIIFALVFYVLWLIQLGTPDLFSYKTIKQFLGIFYANSNIGIGGAVLWFLPTLFLTRVVFAIINKFFTKHRILVSILIIFSICGYLFSVFAQNIKLPFGAEAAMSTIVFYGAGFLWNNSKAIKLFFSKYKYFLFISFLLFGTYISTINFNIYGHQIDMRMGQLNNYFFFYMAAFSGIFSWISFSVILNKNLLLETIGKNSLILFVWHLIVFGILTKILDFVFGLNSTKDIKNFIPLIYTVISIVIILLMNIIYNKFKLNFRKSDN